MSDKRESDREYLTRRGWTLIDNDGGLYCIDNSNRERPAFSLDPALAVQTARDEQEERAAWVQFAAHGPPDPATLGNLCDLDTDDRAAGTAQWADAMLVEYRARFARKVSE